MNNLSWLLYWAGVLPQISAAVCVFSVLALSGSLILAIVWFTCGIDYALVKRWEADPEETRNYVSMPSRSNLENAGIYKRVGFWRILMPICLMAFILALFIPDKNTFYMIAASQAEEKVSQTPEFTKIRAVINKWLDKEANSAPDGGPSSNGN